MTQQHTRTSNGELITVGICAAAAYITLGQLWFKQPDAPTFLGTTQTPFSQETVKAIFSLLIGLAPLFYDRFPFLKRIVDMFSGQNTEPEKPPEDDPKPDSNERLDRIEGLLEKWLDQLFRAQSGERK